LSQRRGAFASSGSREPAGSFVLPVGGEAMLTHPTLDKLQALKLTGMAKGLEEQL
jgi:hypothetical protein